MRLAVMLFLLPALMLFSGWLGHFGGSGFSKLNPAVKRADVLWLYEHSDKAAEPDEVAAFRKTGMKLEEAYSEARAVKSSYSYAGWALGGWLGFVIGLKLIMLSLRRQRLDYEPDRGACVACARCYTSCPKEHQRLKTRRDS